MWLTGPLALGLGTISHERRIHLSSCKSIVGSYNSYFEIYAEGERWSLKCFKICVEYDTNGLHRERRPIILLHERYNPNQFFLATQGYDHGSGTVSAHVQTSFPNTIQRPNIQHFQCDKPLWFRTPPLVDNDGFLNTHCVNVQCSQWTLAWPDYRLLDPSQTLVGTIRFPKDWKKKYHETYKDNQN